jgi:GTPase SAR1 family protein
MLGESGVGKTCIVSRYINDTFTHNPCTTGANYNSKVESVKLEGMTKNVKVKLQIWDTAGSE